jgi:hypothetical protein
MGTIWAWRHDERIQRTALSCWADVCENEVRVIEEPAPITKATNVLSYGTVKALVDNQFRYKETVIEFAQGRFHITVTDLDNAEIHLYTVIDRTCDICKGEASSCFNCGVINGLSMIKL